MFGPSPLSTRTATRLLMFLQGLLVRSRNDLTGFRPSKHSSLVTVNGNLIQRKISLPIKQWHTFSPFRGGMRKISHVVDSKCETQGEKL